MEAYKVPLCTARPVMDVDIGAGLEMEARGPGGTVKLFLWARWPYGGWPRCLGGRCGR